jgi:hypothetical protein
MFFVQHLECGTQILDCALSGLTKKISVLPKKHRVVVESLAFKFQVTHKTLASHLYKMYEAVACNFNTCCMVLSKYVKYIYQIILIK